MTEKTYRLQRSVVHPTVSVLVPSLFVVTLHALCRGSLGLPSSFPDWLIVLCPLASILEAGAGNVAHASRSPPIGRLREIALYLLGTAVLLVLFRVPLHHLGYLFLLIVLSWGVSCAVHSTLRSREDLLRFTEGKTGGELDRALHRSMLVEGDTLTRLARVQRITGALTGTNLAIACGLVLFGARVRPVSAALLILQALSRLVIGAMLNAMDADQRLLGRGLRLNAYQRARRLALGVLAMGTAVFASLLASRSTALVPLSAVARLLERLAEAIRGRGAILGPWLRRLIERLLGWLARLFPRGAAGPLPRGQGFPTVVAEPSALARRVMFAVGMTLLAVGVGVAVAFLTAPLGDRDAREGLTRKRPLRFLIRRALLLLALARRLGRALRESLRALIQESRRRSPLAAEGASSTPAVPRAAVSLVARLRTRRHRSLKQRARRAYARMAAWSKGMGVQPTPALAPLELAHRAGGLVTAHADKLRFAAEMVERVLYGDRPPAAALVVDLERLVRSIVRWRPKAAVSAARVAASQPGRAPGDLAGGRT